jgi:hypothetical protein
MSIPRKAQEKLNAYNLQKIKEIEQDTFSKSVTFTGWVVVGLGLLLSFILAFL